MTQIFTKADGRRSERQMENHFLAVYASPAREGEEGGEIVRRSNILTAGKCRFPFKAFAVYCSFGNLGGINVGEH